MNINSRNLFELFPDYSKREIWDAYNRLRYDQKKIMTIAFGENLEKAFQYQELSNEQNKKLANIIRHVFKRLLKNKDLEVRKNLKLIDYFLNNTFGEIVTSISKLDLEKQFILRKAFGEDYKEHCHSYLLTEKEKRQLYQIIHSELKKHIENLSSNNENKQQHNKSKRNIEEKSSISKKSGPICISLLEYFSNHTYEELDEVISNFNENIKTLVKKAYGNHYDSVENFHLLTNNEKNTIYRYRRKIEDYFSGKITINDLKRKRRNTKRSLIDYLDKIAYDDLSQVIQTLSEEEKNLIYQAYGNNLNNTDGYLQLSSKEQTEVNKIRRKIKNIIEKQTTEKSEEKYSKYKKPLSLTEYFNSYSSDEIKKAISYLAESKRSLLYSIYGENLNQINDYSTLSNNEKKELVRIRKYLKKYLEGSIDKEHLKMRVNNKVEKGKNLFEYLDNFSKDETLEMISLLSKDNQLLLQKVYGENYDTFYGLHELDNNSKNKIYRLRYRLRNKKVFSSHTKEDMQKKHSNEENNKRKNRSLRPLIDNYEKITMEKLLLEIEKLKIEDQLLLQRVYGNNYDLEGSYQSLNTKEKNRVIKIRSIIKSRLFSNDHEGQYRKVKSLNEHFKNYSNNQLEQVINSLLLKEQELLKKAYGNDYDNTKLYSSLTPAEKQKVSSIRSKIKKRLSINDSKKKKTSPLTSISSIKTKKYKRLTRREEIDFVKKAKLSYFYNVSDDEKKKYLEYYFEVFPSKKERYQNIIIQLENLNETIDNFKATSNIEELKKYKNEMVRLEEKRKNLLKQYIDDSKRYRDKFIENNLRLVISVILKMNKNNLPIDELISEGNIGLMRALEKYDVESGNKFSTYATWWIKNKASRYILDNRNDIRIPIHTGEKLNRIKRASSYLLNILYREPTIEELSAETGFKKEEIRELLSRYSTSETTSLDELIRADSDRELSNLIGEDDSNYEMVDEKVFIEQFYELMENANLTEKEIFIIEKRYGLKDGTTHTLAAIGKELGYSIERIRQIEEKALGKIKIIAQRTGFFDNRINDDKTLLPNIYSDELLKEETKTEIDSDYEKLKILAKQL